MTATQHGACAQSSTGRIGRIGLRGRALRSLAFGLAIGCITTLMTGQDLVRTLVYATLISLCCWGLIDGGRAAAVALVARMRGVPARKDPTWPGWALMIPIIASGTIGGVLAGMAIADRLYGVAEVHAFGGGGLRIAGANVLLALAVAAAFTYVIYVRTLIADREAAAQAALRQAAESRLKLIESQLDPHMLFNTLSNLRVLVTTDAPRAQQMLDQLIAFLRATLAGSRAQWHPLAAEFERIGDYLALMEVRMGARLTYALDLPTELAAFAVPPLILQPLVENAIRHGLEPSVDGGSVSVSAARRGSLVELRVTDTGVGYAPPGVPGTSFGLAQVAERLETLYPGSGRLDVGAAPDGRGTIASITLPAQAT